MKFNLDQDFLDLDGDRMPNFGFDSEGERKSKGYHTYRTVISNILNMNAREEVLDGETKAKCGNLMYKIWRASETDLKPTEIALIIERAKKVASPKELILIQMLLEADQPEEPQTPAENPPAEA